jgi:hypothetical protein
MHGFNIVNGTLEKDMAQWLRVLELKLLQLKGWFH